MSDVRIDLVEVDDWCCLYINGEARYQGHTMDASQLLDILSGSKGLLDGCRVTRTLIDDNEDGSCLVPGVGDMYMVGRFPERMPRLLQDRVDGYA